MDTRSNPSAKEGKQKVGLGPEIRDRIARDLRMMWDDVVQEGVPPQFVDFLARLEQQSTPIGDDSHDKRFDGHQAENDGGPRPSAAKDKDPL